MQPEEVLDNIKYIVSTNTDSLNGNGTITVTKVGGGSLDKDKSGLYEVGKATETITIHVATKMDMRYLKLKLVRQRISGQECRWHIFCNHSGSGGVNIEALIKAIETKVYIHLLLMTMTVPAAMVLLLPGFQWHKLDLHKANGQKAKNEWQQISYNGRLYWYYFGADMNMSIGLFTDAKGHQYYLNPAEGALKGTMATGW